MDNNCTYVDGIGSSQAVDTSGEIVDLNGLDCSSFIGSALNWEHKSDTPAQLVGKVLEYKKIFSEADCENDRHKYYWDKCKTPFLYAMGRLFDDKKESSKECAGLFLDDSQHPDEHPMVGFSIEGSKIDKQGMIVTKSIARKLTITNMNANKQCVAEMVPAEPAKADPDSIFKSEPSFTIELLQKAEPMDDLKKAMHSGWNSRPASGKTSAKINMEHPEHGTVSVHENKGKFDVSHYGKPASLKGHKGEGFSTLPEATAHAHKYTSAVSSGTTAGNRGFNRPSAQMDTAKIGGMKKAMSAGSGMASPGSLVGGAALSRESLGPRPTKEKGLFTPSNTSLSTGSMGGGRGGMGKSELLKRAQEEYANWAKREEFEAYMSKAMPELAKGEVKALGQTIALNKSLRAEKKLAKMAAGANMNSWVEKKEPLEKGWKEKAVGATMAGIAALSPGQAHGAQGTHHHNKPKAGQVTHTIGSDSKNQSFNERQFGPYKVKTSVRGTPEVSGQRVTHSVELSPGATHDPKMAQKIGKELGVHHSNFSNLKPGDSWVSNNIKAKKESSSAPKTISRKGSMNSISEARSVANGFPAEAVGKSEKK
jgi:hypothetical protein